MDLCLRAQDKGGKIFVYKTFQDKEFFIEAVEKTYARRIRLQTLADKDKIVSLFSKGATIQRKDFGILMRALRNLDEVYLCNELCVAIEELDSNIDFISLENIDNPIDLTNYEV